ncbi:MAG: hypothetical protein OFPI_08800 [Osedax symbiont Rs2]|nr:MAG: hypothetical protein OFPI_08800 [Osedax symbiont Rs2]
MQKILTRRGIVKPLLIVAAASCVFLLLDKSVELLHKQAASLLMQCSVSAVENTDKFGYSVLAGIALSKASATQMMNLTVALEQFSSALQADSWTKSSLDSCKVTALVYLKVYQ